MFTHDWRNPYEVDGEIYKLFKFFLYYYGKNGFRLPPKRQSIHIIIAPAFRSRDIKTPEIIYLMPAVAILLKHASYAS